MNPKLLENPTFLRYYEKWQKDPKSVVFVAIAEMFKSYEMLDDAIKILVEGLKNNPNIISGRISLAKAYLKSGDLTNARRQAGIILEMSPDHAEAKEIINLFSSVNLSSENPENIRTEGFNYSDEDEVTEDMPISEIPVEDEKTVEEKLSPEDLISEQGEIDIRKEAWQTLTMAKIYAAQGHVDEARGIMENILRRNPGDESVQKEIEKLKSSSQWT